MAAEQVIIVLFSIGLVGIVVILAASKGFFGNPKQRAGSNPATKTSAVSGASLMPSRPSGIHALLTAPRNGERPGLAQLVASPPSSIATFASTIKTNEFVPVAAPRKTRTARRRNTSTTRRRPKS